MGTTPEKDFIVGGPIPLRIVQANMLARLTHSEVRVYVALCAHASGRSGEAYPSVATLADETGLHDRTVQGGLKSLTSAGFVSIAKPGGGRGKPTVYRISDDPGTVTRPESNTIRKSRAGRERWRSQNKPRRHETGVSEPVSQSQNPGDGGHKPRQMNHKTPAFSTSNPDVQGPPEQNEHIVNKREQKAGDGFTAKHAVAAVEQLDPEARKLRDLVDAKRAAIRRSDRARSDTIGNLAGKIVNGTKPKPETVTTYGRVSAADQARSRDLLAGIDGLDSVDASDLAMIAPYREIERIVTELRPAITKARNAGGFIRQAVKGGWSSDPC